MEGLDQRILAAVTRRGRRLLTVQEIEEEGGTEDQIEWRVATGRWQRVHAAVILIGAGDLTWQETVRAATLAADGPAAASHFSTLKLRGLGDFMRNGAEIVVAHQTNVIARGVVVHRTRRPIIETVVDGVPCTSLEQALLDVAPKLSSRLLHQLVTTAWRRQLTTPKKLLVHIEHYGGRGVSGTRKIREVAQVYEHVPRAPGSEAEADFLWVLYRALEAAGIELPVIGFTLRLGVHGTFVVDLAWPDRRKLIEVMGAAAHADYVRQDEAYERAAVIRAHGWDLRDVAPRATKERPEAIARSIVEWLLRPAR